MITKKKINDNYQFFSVKVAGVIAFLATPWIFIRNFSINCFSFSWNVGSATLDLQLDFENRQVPLLINIMQFQINSYFPVLLLE